MSEENRNIIDIIRDNLEKAKRVMNDKIKSESAIMSALNEISTLLNNKVIFPKTERLDNDGDLIINISVQNIDSGYTESLIAYYFHAEKIFPAVFNYQGLVRQSCQSIDDVNTFIERLVSNESFMIKIIRVAETDEKPDDDIPF